MITFRETGYELRISRFDTHLLQRWLTATNIDGCIVSGTAINTCSNTSCLQCPFCINCIAEDFSVQDKQEAIQKLLDKFSNISIRGNVLSHNDRDTKIKW